MLSCVEEANWGYIYNFKAFPLAVEWGIELVRFSYEDSFAGPVTHATLKEARWKNLLILSECNEKEKS